MGGVQRLLVVVVAGMCAGCTSVPARAQPDDRPTLDVSIGSFGILGDRNPLRYGAEYRWRSTGRWSIAPGAGFIVADDDARFYYVDLHRDFPLGHGWLSTLSFGGGYFVDGDDVQLGDRLMFQSGIELGRWVANDWRLGLGFYHLSNGGLSEYNPGTEVLVLLISRAFGRASGHSTAPEAAAIDACPSTTAGPACRSSSRRMSSPASAR